MTIFRNRRRADSEPRAYPRGNRYHRYDHQWYFTTREGILMGPYETREQAVEETEKYIAFAEGARREVLRIMRNRHPIPDQDRFRRRYRSRISRISMPLAAIRSLASRILYSPK